ncbi:hypothetical protein CALCODRAFT_502391 [Calocera cornea HHB12733]|uniref:Uncharacterized protein n=1 Tax=Calocera cornea HHB12733 TaxID=1353952 RepID=A0A165DAC9_9BASI|nr:hypothetical protein CALCODRAFT_502391 [Calocera cornea HHB12733]
MHSLASPRVSKTTRPGPPPHLTSAPHNSPHRTSKATKPRAQAPTHPPTTVRRSPALTQ